MSNDDNVYCVKFEYHPKSGLFVGKRTDTRYVQAPSLGQAVLIADSKIEDLDDVLNPEIVDVNKVCSVAVLSDGEDDASV